MQLTFNIVFTPGTVKYLRLGALTLLRYSPYRYRLVANGLLEDERQLLRRLVVSSNRFDFHGLDESGVLEHGLVLNHLVGIEESDYFCFIDSDIFAVAEFATPLESALQTCDVLSSCRCLLWDPDDVSFGFVGRSTHAPTGEPLPSTFFSVCRTEVVRRWSQELGIGFQRYRHDEMSPGMREIARRFGWNGELCDTGKLLYLAGLSQGGRFWHREFPALVHIGGISSWISKALARVPDGRAQEAFFLSAGEVEVEAMARAQRTEEGDLRFRRRMAAAGYFANYIASLFGDAPEPQLDLTDPFLLGQIEQTRNRLSAAFNEHRDALVAAGDA